MIPIYISSTTGHSGKTFLALGLVRKLMALGHRVGYIKPIGKVPVKAGPEVYDADALFVKETLGLEEPPEVISPFVLTFEAQSLLLAGKLPDVKKKIMAAFRTLKKKDFVVINGSGSLFEGSLMNISPLSLMAEMDARALMVEPWRGEFSADSLYGVHQLLGTRFIGGVINKVPSSTESHVRDTLRPFLEKKGVRIFGVFPRERMLEAVTVRQLNEILHGRVLCCEEGLDEYVENFSIGAMDVDSALSYFRRTPNKAVITGAHRSDIQLAAMETSTKCIILTGGLSTNDVVIGKARAKGIPILTVTDDTFTAVERIESSMGKTSIREQGKVKRIEELLDREFDVARFLKACVNGDHS